VTAFKGRLAVLRGEEVRVDLNAGDGGLGREWAVVLEAVDGDDGAGRRSPGGRGQLLEFALQVVGEGGELGSGEGGSVESAQDVLSGGSFSVDADGDGVRRDQGDVELSRQARG
jgi:hypothetical protein